MQALTDFLHMGGYGAYVWSAFGLSFITLLLGLIVPLLTEKRILRESRKRMARAKQLT